MSRRSRAVPALFVAAVLAQPMVAFAQNEGSVALPSAVSLPGDLEAVLRHYERAWANRDAVALADLFTADAFVLRPGHPPAHGRVAILEAYANSGGPLSLKAYDYGTEGPVGYIIGGYSSGPDRPETGKFVLALRRGPSGEWRIAADIDNGN